MGLLDNKVCVITGGAGSVGLARRSGPRSRPRASDREVAHSRGSAAPAPDAAPSV